MKPSRRKTLNLKVNACYYCGHADRRALRQGRPYCTADNAGIRNGRCAEFMKR